MYVSLSLLLGVVVATTAKIQLEVWPQKGDTAKPLISFRPSDPKTCQPWIQSLDDFLVDYRKNGIGGANRVACNFNSGPLDEGQVCDVPLDHFYPCTAENEYNYQDGAPCVFLKLNQVFNWSPKTYKTVQDLPENMPESLKLYIKSVTGRSEANEVWVSCEGEGPADRKNIGPVQYISQQGFPAYYFPSTGRPGYLSPLVAVLFERPRAGVVINVVCKAWAKNIACKGCEQTASVRFQLFRGR